MKVYTGATVDGEDGKGWRKFGIELDESDLVSLVVEKLKLDGRQPTLQEITAIPTKQKFAVLMAEANRLLYAEITSRGISDQRTKIAEVTAIRDRVLDTLVIPDLGPWQVAP